MKRKVAYYWDDLTLGQQIEYWWKISGRKRYGNYLLVLVPVALGSLATIWLNGLGDVLAISGGFFIGTLYLEMAVAV